MAEDENKCKCGAEGESTKDICPYQHDINNTEEYCNCCDYCREQCRMDI